MFQAWIDPQQRLAWWGDDEAYRGSKMESDLRVGGKWRTEGKLRDGKPFAVWGEYTRIEPPRVLGFTWNHDWGDELAAGIARAGRVDRRHRRERIFHSRIPDSPTRQSATAIVKDGSACSAGSPDTSRVADPHHAVDAIIPISKGNDMPTPHDTHGAFSWNELTTTDTKAARAFYGKLLGWQFQDMDMGPSGTYTVINVDGKGVGGIAGTPPNAKGMPPVWGAYTTVDDVDAVVAKVVQPRRQSLDAADRHPDRRPLRDDPGSAGRDDVADHVREAELGAMPARKSRWSEAQIRAFLRQAAAGTPVIDLCWNHGFSRSTFHAWRSKYGAITAGRLRQAEGSHDGGPRAGKLPS